MEDSQIIDAENFKGSGEGIGFKEICMRQLQRVVTNMSQEMRKGFWIKSTPAPHMTPDKIKYIGDSRKELQASINVLHDLLLPKFDATMKKFSKELNKEYVDWHISWKNKKVSDDEELSYWEKTLRIYRELFQELCMFMERIGWLESTGIEE